MRYLGWRSRSCFKTRRCTQKGSAFAIRTQKSPSTRTRCSSSHQFPNQLDQRWLPSWLAKEKSPGTRSSARSIPPSRCSIRGSHAKSPSATCTRIAAACPRTPETCSRMWALRGRKFYIVCGTNIPTAVFARIMPIRILVLPKEASQQPERMGWNGKPQPMRNCSSRSA